MAAGAERHRAARAADPATGGGCGGKDAAPRALADAAAVVRGARAAAVAAAAPWNAMDRWEARCGAIAALYERSSARTRRT